MDRKIDVLIDDVKAPEIQPEMGVKEKFLLCISAKDDLYGLENSGMSIKKTSSINGLDIISTLPDAERPDGIVLFGEEANEILVNQLQYASQVCDQFNIPLLVIMRNLEYKTPEFASKVRSLILQNGADDCYTRRNLDAQKIGSWIEFLSLYKKVAKKRADKNPSTPYQKFRIDPYKRLVDILVSSVALILLSPLLILISLIIVIESRGPVIYRSKRAGFGYKIFNFYKFRSMRVGADKQLDQLQKLNQYKGKKDGAIFFKIKNDPRVTRFGQFLRNTSLDELPQLFNVLKGDMSLVGNRPLPLYEADKLTKDGAAWRFLAPAGITGLWQVSKRGKDDMSLEERIKLDVTYARKHSIQMDAKILFSTFPAMLQKEKV